MDAGADAPESRDPRAAPYDWLRRTLTLTPWVGAFVVHRALVVRFGIDGAYYWEETYRLLAAKSLLAGWNIPLCDLQADPYAGGSLVMSVLAVPFVAAGGATLTALKASAIAWTAAGLLAWLLFADRYFGRRVAAAFALLFIFAPPLFLKFNLVVMGSHWETVTLTGFQLLAVSAYVYDRERRLGRLAAWGIVAGLSVWFTYISVLAFAACVLFALLAGALPLRRWPALAGAFAVGFAPWLLRSFACEGDSLAVVTRTFAPLGYAAGARVHWYLAALSDLLKKGLPLALQFADVRTGGLVLRREVLGLVYWALFWLAWVVCAWRCGRRMLAQRRGWARATPELPLLIVVPLFIMVIAATEHSFRSEFALLPFLTFRVLVPALPAVFFVCALAYAGSGNATDYASPASPLPYAGSPRWRRAALGVLLGLGALGTFQALGEGAGRRDEFDRHALTTSAEVMGHLLVYNHSDRVDTFEQRIDAIDSSLRDDAYRGVGFSLTHLYARGERPVAGYLNALERLPGEYRGDLIAGARLALGPGIEQVLPVADSRRKAELLEALDVVKHRTSAAGRVDTPAAGTAAPEASIR